MCYHKDIRKVLYIENAPVLRAVTVNEGEIHLANFTQPRETDPDLLIAYKSALATGDFQLLISQWIYDSPWSRSFLLSLDSDESSSSSGTVIESRNPFMYKVLSAHLM